MKLEYTRAYTSFFESPNWAMNLLWTSLAMAVPYVGSIVVYGWCGDVIKSKIERPDEPLPDFDVHKLGYYLSRGLWPFLVALVVELLALVVILPVLLVCILVPVFLTVQSQSPYWIILIVSAPLATTALLLVVQVFLGPMVLRVSLQQEFGSAFQRSFVKKFVRTVRGELLLALLFWFGTTLLLGMAGGMVAIVGAFVAGALSTFAYYHLMMQLYLVYLERGGEPIPIQAPPEIFGPPVPSLAETAAERSAPQADPPPPDRP
ncbi:MAG: DUF4013 domain-containing protein [Planctomycetia bacterium]|nr:DUF4013 domain-containing protein [Planctomycetia bacterium]